MHNQVEEDRQALKGLVAVREIGTGQHVPFDTRVFCVCVKELLRVRKPFLVTKTRKEG